MIEGQLDSDGLYMASHAMITLDEYTSSEHDFQKKWHQINVENLKKCFPFDENLAKSGDISKQE